MMISLTDCLQQWLPSSADAAKRLPYQIKSPRKALVKMVAPPLPQGKLNAIRAAFKAGFTPSRIARQFRISKSDVKKALASDPSK